jgi:hypothetical protein
LERRVYNMYNLMWYKSKTGRSGESAASTTATATATTTTTANDHHHGRVPSPVAMNSITAVNSV